MVSCLVDEGSKGGEERGRGEGRDVPDEELQECRVFRLDDHAHGLHLELEEDAGRSRLVIQDTSIMRYTVLVGMYLRATWSDVSRWHNRQKVLVGNKGCIKREKTVFAIVIRHLRSLACSYVFSRGWVISGK